jgi:hypothetical protein
VSWRTGRQYAVEQVDLLGTVALLSLRRSVDIDRGCSKLRKVRLDATKCSTFYDYSDDFNVKGPLAPFNAGW